MRETPCGSPADSSRDTPSTETTEKRNSVSRQDAESQRGSFCCLPLRLRGLASNNTVEDHEPSRDTPLTQPAWLVCRLLGTEAAASQPIEQQMQSVAHGAARS